MRIIALSLLLTLTGCGTVPTDILTSDMLDVAPMSDYDVKHPDWGKATIVQSSGVEGPYGEKMPDDRNSLESFLAKHNLNYQVLPGNHMMVKLTDTIKFRTGSSQVSNESAYWLDMIGRYIATQPEIDVVIDGHADNTGSSGFNDNLSEKRADAVKRQLMNNRVSQQSIFTRGYGEYAPACSNETRDGKACNRRVEVLFIVSTD